MAYKLCMHCMKIKTGPVCGNCKENDRLFNVGAKLPIGTRLAGRYVVGHSPGPSYIGVYHGYSYPGWDLQGNRPVMIKECAEISENNTRKYAIPDTERSREKAARMRTIWKAQQTLGLPGLPKIWDIFEENGTVYAVQELVEGIPLSEFIRNLGGTLNAAGTVRLLKPLMEDLGQAHDAMLWHGDIRRENILITPGDYAKLRDMCTGEDIGDSDLPVPGPKTPYGYGMERRADVYRMGAVIYECLTGNEIPEYRNRKPVTLDWRNCDSFFTPAMRRAVERALSPDPQIQYLDMNEFCRALFRY